MNTFPVDNGHGITPIFASSNWCKRCAYCCLLGQEPCWPSICASVLHKGTLCIYCREGQTLVSRTTDDTIEGGSPQRPRRERGGRKTSAQKERRRVELWELQQRITQGLQTTDMKSEWLKEWSLFQPSLGRADLGASLQCWSWESEPDWFDWSNWSCCETRTALSIGVIGWDRWDRSWVSWFSWQVASFQFEEDSELVVIESEQGHSTGQVSTHQLVWGVLQMFWGTTL